MDYKDKYSEYYQQIPSDITNYKGNAGKIAIGYTSDLDVVVKWDTKIFAELIDIYLKQTPFLQDNDSIDSMEALVRIVSYYMIHGLGGEVNLSNFDVCMDIEKRFETEFALGGTGAQSAVALAAVGFNSIVHITDMSKEVIRLMDGKGLKIITKDGVTPIIEGVTSELPVRHIIFQYPKGEKILINGVEYETPVSNRLIIDYDQIHKYMPIEIDFLNYCEINAKSLYAYSISGFNAIVDTNIIKNKLDDLAAHYSRLKKNNPNCIIYLEDAHYLNPEVKELLFTGLARYIDILGMNEEELIEQTRRYGHSIDKNSLSSVLAGLAVMLAKYPVKGIVMHTKDYSMYYGSGIKGINIEKGLTLGNLMSGTRAKTGRYGSYLECEDTLELPLSEVGISFAKQLSEIDTDKCVHIVPSKYMEHPKYTIGLGDTFVAGFLISLIKTE